MQLKFILQALLFCLIATCYMGCNSSSKWEKIHPNLNHLPSIEQVNYIIDLSEKNPNHLKHFFDPDSLKFHFSIGNKNSSSLDDRYYYQTRPKKIDIDLDGNIYIAQTHTNSINVYDKIGNYLYSIGTGGKGPGEFIQLITFDFDRNFKTLYALDAFEIEIFSLEDDQFKYKTTVQHKFLKAYDLCLLGENLFVSGYKIADQKSSKSQNGKAHDISLAVTPPISKLELDTFESIKSFGFEYSTYSGYGTYEGILSQMMLSCNETSGTVVGYQKDFPYIFGYDKEGRKKWLSRIDGFEFPKHIEFKSPENARPGLIRYTNEKIYYRKYPIPKIYHAEFELLQLVTMAPQKFYASSEDIEVKELEFRSVLLNTETGELSYSDAYDHVGVKKGRKVITVHRDPETYQRVFKIHDYK